MLHVGAPLYFTLHTTISPSDAPGISYDFLFKVCSFRAFLCSYVED